MPAPLRALLLLLWLCTSMHVWAQFKYEHEERMPREEVPDTARAFVEALALKGRVRWYREQGYDRSSIEAKVRHRGQRYSIEFDATGRFEDVEVEVKAGDVPAEAWARITAGLADSLGRHRVQKVQVRHTGHPEAVLRKLRGPDPPGPGTGYELMVSARVQGTYVLFEYEFAADGAFVRRDRVVLRHADHILY